MIADKKKVKIGKIEAKKEAEEDSSKIFLNILKGFKDVRDSYIPFLH